MFTPSKACPYCPNRLDCRNGLLRCMGSMPLWLSAARLEAACANVPKARALLEQARLKNPKNEVRGRV